MATATAIRYFERVIGEYGGKGRAAAELARQAKPELNELRSLTLGKPAPPTAGTDLDGKPLDLASFRDGQGGPIATAWNVRSWQTRIVVDAKGRIHYRSGYERDLEAVVDALLAEPGAQPRKQGR